MSFVEVLLSPGFALLVQTAPRVQHINSALRDGEGGDGWGVASAARHKPGPAGEQIGRALELSQPGQRRGPMLSILTLVSGMVVLPSRRHEPIS